MQQKIVVWKVLDALASIPSVRFRCLYPAMALEELGWRSIILERCEDVSPRINIDTTVIVKSFRPYDFKYVLSMKKRCKNIVIDLCDNMFIKENSNPDSPLTIFKKMMNQGLSITTTGEPLAQQIKTNNPNHADPIIIPDGCEHEGLAQKAENWLRKKRHYDKSSGNIIPIALNRNLIISSLSDQVKMSIYQTKEKLRHFNKRIKKKLSKNKPILTRQHPATSQQHNEINYKKLIWYGTAGNDQSLGLRGLALIKQELEALHTSCKVSLKIVTNEPGITSRIMEEINIPYEYIQWKADTIRDSLKKADVCLIPRTHDKFNSCKSSNRALLALDCGTPVVATSIPSMKKLEGAIELDDFYHGTLRLLEDPAYVDQQISKAKKLINGPYSWAHLAKSWNHALA